MARPPATKAAPTPRRLAERPEAELPADAARVGDQRVERHDGRALLGRHDLVQVGLPDGARHADRAGHEQERRQREPERPGQPDADRRARLDDGRAEEERRPPPAAPREHLDELVAGDRRERDRRRDEPGDPDRVALEQVEQVRLRGVERPREEPRLHERREHQEAQRGLRPTEVDARAGVARDLPGQLASRDATRREAEVVHHDPGDDEDGHEEHGADDVRQREVDLAE